LIDAVTSEAAVAISCVVPETCWIEDALSWIAAPVSAIEAARLVVFAVTWSIGGDRDRLGLHRRLLERGGHLVDAAERAIKRAQLRVGPFRDLVVDARDGARRDRDLLGL